MFFAKLLPRKKFPVLIKATFRFTSLRRKNTFSCAHMIHKLSKQASPRSSTALDTCLRIHLLVERCNQWSHSSHLTLQDGETLSRNRKESDWRTGYTKSFTTNSDAAKKLIDSGVAFAHVDVSGVFGDSPGTHSFGCSLSWHCGGHKISQNDVCQKIPSLLADFFVPICAKCREFWKFVLLLSLKRRTWQWGRGVSLSRKKHVWNSRNDTHHMTNAGLLLTTHDLSLTPPARPSRAVPRAINDTHSDCAALELIQLLVEAGTACDDRNGFKQHTLGII